VHQWQGAQFLKLSIEPRAATGFEHVAGEYIKLLLHNKDILAQLGEEKSEGWGGL